MIEKGAFDGLDACMMTHPSPADIVYCTILSVGGFKAEFFGKASHASASPWEGKQLQHVSKALISLLSLGYDTDFFFFSLLLNLLE